MGNDECCVLGRFIVLLTQLLFYGFVFKMARIKLAARLSTGVGVCVFCAFVGVSVSQLQVWGFARLVKSCIVFCVFVNEVAHGFVVLCCVPIPAFG